MANRFLYDAIIVGGGVSGASIAYSLSKRNIRTLLLERHDDVASEGSGNPTGLIYPNISENHSLENDFSYSAFQYTVKEIEHLLNDKEFSPVSFSKGTFQIPISEKEKSYVLSAIKNDPSRASEITYCKDEYSGQEGFLYTNGLTVPPRRLTKRLIESCRENLEVETYSNYLGHIQTETFQVRTDSAVYSSKFLFFCHSNGFIETPDTNWIPLQRVRGQIVLLPNSELLKNLPYSYLFGGYLTKDIGSGSVLGASSDEIHMDETIRIHETVGFLHQASKALPKLKDHFKTLEGDVENINTRVSFRLQTLDKNPIFGKLPDFQMFKDTKATTKGEIPYIENLFVLGALGSKGLTHAIYASEIIVREALGESSLIDQKMYQAFKPERFLEI